MIVVLLLSSKASFFLLSAVVPWQCHTLLKQSVSHILCSSFSTLNRWLHSPCSFESVRSTKVTWGDKNRDPLLSTLPAGSFSAIWSDCLVQQFFSVIRSDCFVRYVLCGRVFLVICVSFAVGSFSDMIVLCGRVFRWYDCCVCSTF